MPSAVLRAAEKQVSAPRSTELHYPSMSEIRDAINQDALSGALAHSHSVAEVLAVLDSSGGGLDSDTARQRLAAYGANELPAKKPRPAFLRFLAHFNDVLIYILIAAGVLKASSPSGWISP